MLRAQEDAGQEMSQRFSSVPNALSYTFILLSGDYPLVEFTFWGRMVRLPHNPRFIAIYLHHPFIHLYTRISLCMAMHGT